MSFCHFTRERDGDSCVDCFQFQSLTTVMTLKDDMHKAMEDTDLHDITLIGADGLQITTIKSVLIIRSPVFRHILTSGLLEDDKMALTYDGLVL